jgi:hypothetical protein
VGVEVGSGVLVGTGEATVGVMVAVAGGGAVVAVGVGVSVILPWAMAFRASSAACAVASAGARWPCANSSAPMSSTNTLEECGLPFDGLVWFPWWWQRHGCDSLDHRDS